MSLKTGERICSLGCVLRKEIVNHVAPNPEKDLPRFLKWMAALGLEDVKGMAVYKQIHHKLRICDNHFNKVYLLKRNLTRNAVPTLLLKKFKWSKNGLILNDDLNSDESTSSTSTSNTGTSDDTYSTNVILPVSSSQTSSVPEYNPSIQVSFGNVYKKQEIDTPTIEIKKHGAQLSTLLQEKKMETQEIKNENVLVQSTKSYGRNVLRSRGNKRRKKNITTQRVNFNRLNAAETELKMAPSKNDDDEKPALNLPAMSPAAEEFNGVCRACLSEETVLHELSAEELQNDCQLLDIECGAEPAWMPRSVCGTCFALLRKLREFRARAQLAHRTLLAALQSHHQLAVAVRSVDRASLGLRSPLARCCLDGVSVEPAVVCPDVPLPRLSELSSDESDSFELDSSSNDEHVDGSIKIKSRLNVTKRHFSATSLSMHMGLEGSFQCDCCLRSFDDRPTLRKHLRRHDEQETRIWTIEPHVCEACYKGFTNIRDLRKHQSSHKERTLRNVDINLSDDFTECIME